MAGDPRDRMKAMQARDLLVQMLVIDSSRRISVNDALAVSIKCRVTGQQQPRFLGCVHDGASIRRR